jgi:hypothetical protein
VLQMEPMDRAAPTGRTRRGQTWNRKDESKRGKVEKRDQIYNIESWSPLDQRLTMVTDLEMRKLERNRSSPRAWNLHLGMGGQCARTLATARLPIIVSSISITGCALAAHRQPRRREFMLPRRLHPLSHAR